MKFKLFPENKNTKNFLIIFCLIILGLSCYYNYSIPIGLKILMSDPENNDNKEITISGEVRTDNKPFYSLYDATNKTSFIVKNTLEDWKINDFIALRGKFKKEGYLEYVSGEIIWDKKIKLAISIVAFIALIILFISEFKKLRFEI
jgi:hypothetical protein